MTHPVPALLGHDASVQALVGTNPVRIYRGTAPLNTARPYLTWRTVFASPQNYLSERPAIDGDRTQLDCWADTEDAVDELARVVRHALEPHGYELGVNIDEKDPETGLRRISFDWSFWITREPGSS